MMRERTERAHQRNIALRLMILSVADSADTGKMSILLFIVIIFRYIFAGDHV